MISKDHHSQHTAVLGPGDVTPAVLDLPVGSDTHDRSTIIACGHSARKQSYKYRSNPTHERIFFVMSAHARYGDSAQVTTRHGHRRPLMLTSFQSDFIDWHVLQPIEHACMRSQFCRLVLLARGSFSLYDAKTSDDSSKHRKALRGVAPAATCNSEFKCEREKK
jgi:hypothetical protein